jgi:N-acetylmuramoyl-L-alanine amidase
MKIIPTSLLLLLFVGLNSVPVMGQETVTVIYDDGRETDELPAWQVESDSEALYLRAHDVARIFKATQFWNASSRKVVLGVEKTRFTLTLDTRVVVVDGEPVMMKSPIRYDAGFVMIPMEFVLDIAAPYSPSVLSWDTASNTLRVEKIGYNVESVSFSSTQNRSVATIRMTEPLIYHPDTTTPGLIRLKIYGGRVDVSKFDLRQARGLFNGVRAEQTDRDAYVYFDIKQMTSRVIVERQENPPSIAVVLEQGELPEIPDPDLAGRKKIEFIDDRPNERRKLTINTVVLDPGHGGKDNGKAGRNGILEKEVNLMIAQRARVLLERELGVDVILTRESDELLSLTRRTEIANESGGDLFVSIHCNSWFSSETGGFEAYFLSPARTEWDKAVAMAENSADDFAAVGSADLSSDISFILWDLVQNEYINESSYLAEVVQKAMSDRLSIRDRGVKQANFTVLQGARMPAVLIETAFLSNPTEEALLTDESFQDQVARGLVEAIRLFRERYR